MSIQQQIEAIQDQIEELVMSGLSPTHPDVQALERKLEKIRNDGLRNAGIIKK